MILWNDNVSIGDVIGSFPATLQYAQQHQITELYWTRPEVATLFPYEKYGMTHVESLPTGAPVTRISMHDMCHYGLKHPSQHQHPTCVFMAHVGFPELSHTPMRPEIVFDRDAVVPHYDFLLSPYILAELERMWALPKWQSVINELHKLYPGASIGVLAGTTIPNPTDLKKINPYTQAHFYTNAQLMAHTLTGVTYEVDRPLREVAAMMAHVKRAVITTDSGPARLMHAVGGPHLLLCNTAVDRQWGTYPEAKSLYVPMTHLEPYMVLGALRELLHDHSPLL